MDHEATFICHDCGDVMFKVVVEPDTPKVITEQTIRLRQWLNRVAFCPVCGGENVERIVRE